MIAVFFKEEGSGLLDQWRMEILGLKVSVLI
jgi:hypothetical protein